MGSIDQKIYTNSDYSLLWKYNKTKFDINCAIFHQFSLIYINDDV
jgi:hypothetical protein